MAIIKWRHTGTRWESKAQGADPCGRFEIRPVRKRGRKQPVARRLIDHAAEPERREVFPSVFEAKRAAERWLIDWQREQSGVDPHTGKGTWFITLYVHSWGRGRTAEQSRDRAKEAGGYGNEWLTYRLPPDVRDPYVNEMGTVCWSWPEDWSEEECHERNRDPKRSSLELIAHGNGMKIQKDK